MALKIVYWIIATILALIGAVIVCDNNFQFAGSETTITQQGNACVEVRIAQYTYETCYKTNNDSVDTYLTVMGWSTILTLFVLNILLAYLLYRLLMLVKFRK